MVSELSLAGDSGLTPRDPPILYYGHERQIYVAKMGASDPLLTQQAFEWGC